MAKMRSMVGSGKKRRRRKRLTCELACPWFKEKIKLAEIKRILESPTMPTIWVKEATRRKLVRSKVKNMEMSLQVSLHWQSVT